MNGYIKNKSPMWRHAMKRSVGPGHTVSLDDIYDQYGEKHGIEKGMPFVEWLKQVKLRDADIWEIVYEEKKKKAMTASKVEADKVSKEVTDGLLPFVKKDLEVDEIVNFSVRKAREELPKITDLNLLKYAYKHVNQLANKDTLTRMIRKRVVELEVFKR